MNERQLKSPQGNDIRRLKRLAWGAILLLVLTTVGIVGVGSVTYFRFQEINQTWKLFHEDPELKGLYMNQIRSHFGYGGFIHHFKNYVLRQDEALLPEVRKNLVNLRSAVDHFEAIGVNSAEKRAIAGIRTTIDEYEQKLKLAEVASAKGYSPKEIDKRVRVNDSVAFAAFATLKNVWQERYRVGSERQASAVLSGTSISKYSLLILPLLMVLLIGIIWFLVRLIREVNERAVRLRSVMESVVDGIITITDRGIIESINPAGEQIFGFTAEETIGRNVNILMPEPHRAGHDTYLQNYVKGAPPKIIGTGREVTGQRKDGSVFPLDLAVSETSIDGRRLFTGIVRDITERKQAEEELRKLSQSVEQNPNMIFITDKRGIIQYVNPTFTEMTGYTSEEAIGQNPRFLKSGEMPHETYEDLWQTILSGSIWRREIKDRCKDGSTFWSSATIAPVMDDTNTVTHFVAMHENITERKDAEEREQAAREQAEIANRAKSELLANMSHELRTPLNAIIGFSSSLIEGYFGPLSNEKQQEYVGDIHASGQHLLEIINDILDVSAIEAGKLVLHEEPVNLRVVFQSVSRIVEGHAKEGGIKLSMQTDDRLPAILADERRVKQILINLVANAIKFTPKGGSVIASAEITDKGSMILSVTDTGIGMNETGISKALTQFGQVDGGLDRKHEGTGLGLPLTKGLAELHGGTLYIDSTPGTGTCVTVRFPPSRILKETDMKAAAQA